MGVGPLRGVLTGATARRAVRLQVFSRTGLALAVLVVVAGAASAVGPAASRHGASVPSTVDCQRLLTRSPAPAGRPVQLPPQTRLIDEVTDFVESAPSGQRYVFPTAAERARFQCGFQYAAARQLANAARLLQPLQYDVKQLGDASTPAGKRFVLLEERRSRGRDGVERYRRAWGLYVIATRTRVPVLAVEVPHPCKSTARCNAVGGDRRTHTMAVTTFERAGAKYLFVAGTDRGATAVGCPQRPCSADVAHEGASMFEAVHEMALVSRLSLHGRQGLSAARLRDDAPPTELSGGRGLGRNRARRIAGDRDDASGAPNRGGPERRCERCLRGKGAAIRPGRRPTAAARRPRRLLASGRPSGWVGRDHERPGPVRSPAHPGS